MVSSIVRWAVGWLALLWVGVGNILLTVKDAVASREGGA
jgi:hypothetical protein